MKNLLRLTLLFASALPSLAFAEETGPQALVPLPSVADFTRGGGWGVGLGAGVEYETAYDGADEYEFELDPAGAVQWRSGDQLIFWEGIELGWRGLVSDGWLLQAGLRYEGGLEPDESEDGHLDGLEERDSHLTAFVEGRWSPRGEWRNWVGGACSAGAETSAGSPWSLGAIAGGERTDGTGTEIFAFTTFATSAFMNKDFGVSEQDANNSMLAQTSLDGGYRSLGVTLISRNRLAERLQLVWEIGLELYSDEIQDSPISRQEYETEAGVALIWQF